MAYCLLLSLLVGAAATLASAESFVLQAHRGLHFDRESGVKGEPLLTFGTRATTIRQGAALYDPANPTVSAGHSVLVVSTKGIVQETDPSVLLTLSTAGYVFLLGEGHQHSAAALRFLTDLEEHLESQTVALPVYFAPLEGNGTRLIETIKGHRGSFGGFASFVLENALDATPKKIENQNLKSLSVSMQPAIRDKKTRDALPVLLVVASHDTSSAAPTLSAKGSGSGVALWLELVRIFSQAYKGINENAGGTAAPTARIIFVLSDGRRFNYQGTKSWLMEQTAGLVDNIDFALCLEDTVDPRYSADGAEKAVSGDQLYLHVSRAPKDENVKSLYEDLTEGAKKEGLPFQVVLKKINVSHHEMRWEHEPFSYRKTLGGTLSALKSPVPQAIRLPLVSPLSDKEVEQRMTSQITKQATLVAKFLAKRAGISLPATDLTSSTHINSWVKFHQRQPRPVAVGAKSPVDIWSVYQGAISELTESVPAVAAKKGDKKEVLVTITTQTKDFPLKSEITNHGPYQVSLGVHDSKDFSFEVVVLGLSVLNTVLVGAYFFGMGWTVDEFQRTLKMKK